MRKNISPLFTTLSFFLALSCVKTESRSVTVIAQNKNGPVAHMEVFMGEKSLGSTDKDGRLSFEFPENRDSVRITLKSSAMDELYLPKSVDVSAQTKELSVVLKEIEASVGAQFSEEPPLLNPPIAETDLEGEEFPLSEEIVTETAEVKPQTSIQANQSLIVLLQEFFVPKFSPVVLELPDASMEQKPVTVQVNSIGKPTLAGAKVFLGRSVSGGMRYIGTTDETGKVKFKTSSVFRPDQVIVRKEGYKPSVSPLLAQDSLAITLEAAVAHDFYAFNYAFGASRGISSVTRSNLGAKIDISGPLGVMIDPRPVAESNYEVKSQDTFPETVKLKPQSGRPSIAYMSLKKPVVPKIGVIEPVVRDDLNWLKFRREFQARFMQSTSIRPMLSAEVSKYFRAMELSKTDALKKGWSQSVLEYELDFILQMLTPEETGTAQWAIRLVDRNGTTVAALSVDIASSPEEKASELYSSFMKLIPFEGAVKESTEAHATINLGTKNYLEIGDHIGFFSSSADSTPIKTMAYGKVESALGDESIVKVDKKLGVGVRAVKLTNSLGKMLFGKNLQISDDISLSVAQKLKFKDVNPLNNEFDAKIDALKDSVKKQSSENHSSILSAVSHLKELSTKISGDGKDRADLYLDLVEYSLTSTGDLKDKSLLALERILEEGSKKKIGFRELGQFKKLHRELKKSIALSARSNTEL